MSNDLYGGDGDWIEALRRRTGSHTRSLEYTNWMDEQLSWKETCYIGWWNFLPDLEVTGPEAVDLFVDLSVNSFADFRVGQAKHVVQCNADGKVIGEGILMRQDEETYVVQGVASWPKYNLERGSYDATGEFRDTFNYQVQGPNSLAVLEAATDGSLRDIGFMDVGQVTIAGHDVDVLRQGMSGEVGFELQGPTEHGNDVHEAVLEAGEDYGIRRLGSRVQIINHLEACFPTSGYHYLNAIFDDDLRDYRSWLASDGLVFEAAFSIEGSFDGDKISDWYRSPVELGWMDNIAFDHEFIGREALETEVANPKRTTVTLVWEDGDVVDVYASLFDNVEPNKFMEMPTKQRRTMQADSVLKDGLEVGVSTGRGYSYYFRDMISLATIDVEYSEPGTEVRIVWGEGGDPPNPTVEPHVPMEIRATVAEAPYKTDRRRTDLTELPGTG